MQSGQAISHKNKEGLMQQRPLENEDGSLDRRPSDDWGQLIRKLRWIGLEDEARRLELAVGTLPPEERGSVSVGPFSTD
jgi:hypothetical protein